MDRTSTTLWPIPVQLVATVATELKQYGIEPDTLLEGTLVTEQDLFKTDKLLPYRLTQRILQRAYKLSPIPHLGFSIADRQSPSGMGMLGYLINCCSSVAQAMDMTVKYHRVSSTLLHSQWYQAGEYLYWISIPPKDLENILPMIVEEEFYSLCRTVYLLTGQPFSPSEVHFQYPEPDYVALYHKIFNCPLFFSADENKVVMGASLLNRTILQANPLSVDAAERKCIEFLNNNPILDDLVLSVRQLILDENNGSLNEQAVSNKLNITSRTLRNRLSRLGTSFQLELNTVKEKLAVNHLIKTDLKISQIAERMGYSDARSFRRAFKTWTGNTPLEFRNKNL